MKKRKRRFGLAQSPESLERRSMLAANLIDVSKVAWNGQLVDAVKNEYVLRMPQLNARTATSPIDYQHNRPTVQPGWSLQSLGSGFYKLTAPGVTQATLANWASRNGVQSVNVNAVRSLLKAPNDPLYGDAANWAFPQIKAADAWDTGTGTTSTIVAVLDSGVDYNHPDLTANMWRNPNEVPNDGIDNDSNGWIDDYYGVNTIGGNGNPMDDNGHGTFCAGLIGAVGDNGVGIAGVNWSVQVMAVKVFDAVGNTSIAAIVSGVQYVISQKIAGQNVAASNHSYGGYGFVQQEFDALNQLASTGVVIVAAAGNDSNNNDTLPAYPASYTIPGLISVAASTQSDSLAGFSNYGVASVDLAAPGVSVLSTRLDPGGIGTPLAGNSEYGTASGTSFAAPLVAGTAGLLKSLKLGASPEQVKTAILDGVDKIASLNGQVLTGGRLNVDRAVDLILATQGATPVATFTVGQSLSFLEGSAGFSYAEVKVSLDRPADPGKSVSVWYETRPGGSAFPGIDFEATSGLLTFSGRETQKSFRIKLIGDRMAEQTEQFAVQLTQAKSRGVTVGTQQANVIILDDDNTTTPVQPGPTNPGLVPQVSVDVKRDANGAPLPIREGGVATFVIALDKTTTTPVSVRYRTTQPSLVPPGTALAGLDYTATQGTMTFAPGQRVKEFTVPILVDQQADANETFRVVLTEPIGCDLAGAGATPSGAVSATITDVPFIPPPQPGFQITVSFPDSSLTPSQQQVFQQAATRWQEVIVGDLPNVTDPATGQVIDDILIVATGVPLDGAGGILGGAQPTAFRPGTRGLPWKGEMVFDTADIQAMASDGTFLGVVLHEMAHALGFGAIWQQFGLVQGAGTTNPLYVGTNALREYRSLFGVPNARGVPLETAGGAGTAGSHWSEAVFVNELMTGFVEAAGVAMPISRITVGQFQDLGYQVNYTKADAYAKPAVRATVPPASTPKARLRLAAMAPISQSTATALAASEIARASVSSLGARAFASLVAQPRAGGQARTVRGLVG
ncbi:MAG: S8 family serine peptidase [Planctomycetaceae bacterium]